MDPATEEWDLSCSDPDISEISKYFWAADELLDYCGELLYGQRLFPVMHLLIRRAEAYNIDGLGDGYRPEPGKKLEWLFKAFRGGQVSCRQLETKHEVFGMLIAEIRLGAAVVEVRHKSLIAPAESE